MHFWVPKTYELSLKTLSADKMDSTERIEALFLKTEDLFGHLSNFYEVTLKHGQKSSNRHFSSYIKMDCIIWTRFLCHFQNGALHFCTPNIGKVINKLPIFTHFRRVLLKSL